MSLSIPIIDMSSGLHSLTTADQLAEACEDWGFFQLVGHDVKKQLRQDFFAGMQAFFTLPRDQKLVLSRNEQNYWGYYDKELTKNLLDAKEIYDIDANLENLVNERAKFPVPWPTQLPELRALVTEWLAVCESLSQQLLAALCMVLSESSATLNPFFIKNHSSFLRFNYYPSASERNPDSRSLRTDEDHSLGIHPHTDAGALTVLAQDAVPGLQVRKGDTWHTIIPEDDSFIINIGDMMQVWSNDRFIAPEHRVLASEDAPRLSAPYFYNPSYETICVPLLTNDENPRYRPIRWGEFRRGRAAGDYADLGEEIQISWFRI